MKPLKERAVRKEVEIPVPIPTDDGKGIAEKIHVKVSALCDPKTGEIFLDGAALSVIDRAKARYMGLLSPAEIKFLRLTTLGLSQQEMSELLKIGEKTYTRWESGRERPSQSLNLLLRALRDGKLDVGYLRSGHRARFDWKQVVPTEIQTDQHAEPITIQTEIHLTEATTNEALALAA